MVEGFHENPWRNPGELERTEKDKQLLFFSFWYLLLNSSLFTILWARIQFLWQCLRQSQNVKSDLLSTTDVLPESGWGPATKEYGISPACNQHTGPDGELFTQALKILSREDSRERRGEGRWLWVAELSPISEGDNIALLLRHLLRQAHVLEIGQWAHSRVLWETTDAHIILMHKLI